MGLETFPFNLWLNLKVDTSYTLVLMLKMAENAQLNIRSHSKEHYSDVRHPLNQQKALHSGWTYK